MSRVAEDYRKWQNGIESGEEQLEEAQDLIMSRLDEIIEEEIKPLIKEIEGLDYGLNAKELIIEHLENIL